MSEHSSTPSDLPDLEEPEFVATSSRPVILNYEALPMGDKNTEPNIDAARNLKSVALELKRTGNIEKAIEVATQAIETAPTLAFPFLLRAELLSHLGQSVSAEKDLREACTRAPNSSPAHLALARLMVKRGARQDALLEFRKALGIEPSPEVSQELAECERVCKEMEEEAKREEEKKRKEEAETIKGKQRSFEPSQGLPNPFKILEEEAKSLSPEAAARLLGNPDVAKLMADPTFAEKLNRLASNPSGSGDLLKDKEFLKNMGAVIGTLGKK